MGDTIAKWLEKRTNGETISPDDLITTLDALIAQLQDDRDQARRDWAAVLTEGSDPSSKEIRGQKLQRTYRVPPGSITAYAGDINSPADAPAGWLLCDGSQVEGEKYPELAVALGRAKDAPFPLPDLRGYFLRGVDPEGTVDVDRKNNQHKIRSTQDDGFRAHNHPIFIPFIGYESGNPHADLLAYANWSENNKPKRGADSIASGGSETRPVNFAVHWIIKW